MIGTWMFRRNTQVNSLYSSSNQNYLSIEWMLTMPACYLLNRGEDDWVVKVFREILMMPIHHLLNISIIWVLLTTPACYLLNRVEMIGTWRFQSFAKKNQQRKREIIPIRTILANAYNNSSVFAKQCCRGRCECFSELLLPIHLCNAHKATLQYTQQRWSWLGLTIAIQLLAHREEKEKSYRKCS